MHLLNYCKANGHEYISYDPEGLGNSVSSQEAAMDTLSNIEFRHWVQNCEQAIRQAKCDKVRIVTINGSYCAF